MAEKEKRTEPEAFIDYGADCSSEPSERWNHEHFKSYWKEKLREVHGYRGVSWGIKDQTLLKRLRQQYEPETLQRMMDEWVMTKGEYAPDFGLFYKNRYTMFQKTEPKNYEW